MTAETAIEAHQGARAGRGGAVRSPAAITGAGWRQVLSRTRAESRADNAPLLAAGVAFFALLAAVPALGALVYFYGLIASPEDVSKITSDLLRGAPQEVRDLVEVQLREVMSGRRSSAGIGAGVGAAIALWSASSGTRHAIAAANAAYDEDESRGFMKLRALSLVLTIGLAVFVVTAFALITVLPALVDDLSGGGRARLAMSLLRWPVLAIGSALALAVFYRFAPDRHEPQWRWVSPGAVVATLMWLGGSIVLSAYTANAGRFNETYGSLGVIVVVMLWLFLGAYAVVFGAELNAEVQRGQGEPPA